MGKCDPNQGIEGKPTMATRDHCKGTYEPTKSWQRFCGTKCHDDWHYHQKKLAQVEEAERLRELRLANGAANGNGAAHADPPLLSELLRSLKPSEPKSAIIRRI